MKDQQASLERIQSLSEQLNQKVEQQGKLIQGIWKKTGLGVIPVTLVAVNPTDPVIPSDHQNVQVQVTRSADPQGQFPARSTEVGFWCCPPPDGTAFPQPDPSQHATAQFPEGSYISDVVALGPAVSGKSAGTMLIICAAGIDNSTGQTLEKLTPPLIYVVTDPPEEEG